MWKALSKAEQQKWKNDAPMVKVRVKSTDLPPPDDETKAKYKACAAAPSCLLTSDAPRTIRDRRFKKEHPDSKDAKTIGAFQLRDPASFPSFFAIVRRSFSGTAARGGALLRSRESGVATRGRRRLRRDATT